MRQSHLIISNACIIWVSRILLLIPQIILVPYLIRTIGEVGYGVYALIWSLLIGVDRLERSLQSGVVKYSAAFLAEKRIDEVNRVISSSFIYSVLLAAVASSAILIVAFLNGTGGDLGLSLFIVGIIVLLMIPLTPYVAVIQARQRYYVGVLAQTLSKYIGLGLIFLWFGLVGPSVEALVVVMAGMLLLSRIVQVPVAHRLVPGMKNRPRFFDRNTFCLIVAFGGTIVFAGLCQIANTTGIRWLMGWLVSTSFVAHLAIMLMPAMLLSQIVTAMTVTIMPATSAYNATGNERMLRELLVRSMRYTAVIVLAGLLSALLLVENIVMLWIGPEYLFLVPYMLIIMASTGLLVATSSAHHMLKGLNRLRTIIIVEFTGKVFSPFALIMVMFLASHNPYLSITIGLAIGNTISAALNVICCTRAVDASLRRVLFYALGQPMAAAVAVATIVFATISYGHIDDLKFRLGLTCMTLLVFMAQMSFLFATPEERRLIRAILRNSWRHISTAFKRLPCFRSFRV